MLNSLSAQTAGSIPQLNKGPGYDEKPRKVPQIVPVKEKETFFSVLEFPYSGRKRKFAGKENHADRAKNH